MPLDTRLLQKKKHQGDKIIAQCPACASAGSDNTGNHFFLNLTTGKFGCVANEGDSQHRKEIFALVGIKDDKPREFSPLEKQQYRKQKELEKFKRKSLAFYQSRLPHIRQSHKWSVSDVLYDSPIKLDDPLTLYDPRYLIKTLFHPSDIIWTGETWQSGEYGLGRFKTASEWQNTPIENVGPMISPATWKDNTTSRTKNNILSSPYHVLDFDEINGRKPKTQKEKDSLVEHALAITHFLINEHKAKLAAIIHTGNKSLHVWIETKSLSLSFLKLIQSPFELDHSLIGQPQHPCRLTGQTHSHSQKISKPLWLREPYPPLK